MSLDLFQNYFPALSDIPEATALDVRQRLDTYTKAGWPELDTRPNTPFGDFHMTPMAYLIAGLEIAMDRFRSDLNLENVANGVIYDCDFVRQFLNNFAVTEREDTGASGVVRMLFNSDQEYALDRGFQFSFGTYTLAPYAPNSGGVMIRRVGDLRRVGMNDVLLVDRGDGTYSADVPVTGTAAGITAGDTASVSVNITELVSVYALYDFIGGETVTSLPALAARSRKTSYSASNGTPGGILRFMDMEFPGLVSSSVATSGDAEMKRDSINPFGVADARVDIMARSAGYRFSERQTIRLPYVASADRYMVKLALVGQPYLLNGIYGSDGVTSIARDFYSIFSKSSDSSRALKGAAAYSNLEDLYLVVEMPTDTIGTPILDVGYTTLGESYIDVVIDYRTDPLLPVVANTMTGREHKTMGVDTLVKGFIPVVFTSFVIHYTRKSGSTVKMDLARSEVLDYVNTVGYPDAFSEARLHDGVFLAGAHDVVEVEAVGEVRWSLADYFLNDTTPDPLTDYTTCVEEKISPPRVTFPSLRSLRSGYVGAGSGSFEGSEVAIGIRNMTFILDDSVVSFVEEHNR